jgi:hypothetical protein
MTRSALPMERLEQNGDWLPAIVEKPRKSAKREGACPRFVRASQAKIDAAMAQA